MMGLGKVGTVTTIMSPPPSSIVASSNRAFILGRLADTNFCFEANCCFETQFLFRYIIFLFGCIICLFRPLVFLFWDILNMKDITPALRTFAKINADSEFPILRYMNSLPPMKVWTNIDIENGLQLHYWPLGTGLSFQCDSIIKVSPARDLKGSLYNRLDPTRIRSVDFPADARNSLSQSSLGIH